MAAPHGPGDAEVSGVSLGRERLHVVGFAGSLRRASFNRALLRAAVEEAPEGMEVEVLDVSQVPVFNADLEAELPASVATFQQAIAAADGVLIVTPEYNAGVPGLTKNLVDWASRPSGDAVIRHKPVAVMGATRGSWGTVRAQALLRQSLSHIPAYDMKKPEVMVPHAPQKFDEAGRLTDEETRRRVRALLEAFREWILVFRNREG